MQSAAKERVLVVDDEPQVLVALEDLLGERFSVLTTESAEDALRLLNREQDIAVLITDQRMPKMTGDQLVAQLVGSSDAQRILLTGFADLSAVIRAVNEGRIFAYVTKPWNAEDLQLKVQTAVDHFRLTKELAYERQLLHDLMENIPDWIYFKDKELRYRRTNRSFAARLGARDGRDIVGKRAEEIFLTRADAAQTAAEEQRLLTEGEPILDLLREYHWNGEQHWLSETKAPIRDDHGRVEGLVGISRDVTERVVTQEALRKSEERLQKQTRLLNSILDSMGEGVIALGPTREILLFNRRARKILGTQLQGALPSDWMKICGVLEPDGKTAIPPSHDPLQRTIQGASSTETELFVSSASGPGAVVAVTATPLVEADGKLAGGGIALLRDVTRQRSLEQQLIQAQKMEAIGRLAGGVAHDFNNLLAVILSYGELVLKELDSQDPTHSDVSELIAATLRAAALTRQLLAFSRQQMFQARSLQLNEIVSNLEKMLRRIIGEDIELVTKLFPKLSPVKADPSQLEQIIVNLTVNARDAMPEGGTLTIETTDVVLSEDYALSHAGVTPGDFVMLVVTDTGTGMDAATKRHIFEPFFTTKDVGKGTGLGLSTVYGIVQQSGGHIWVDSELQRGTSFKLYFPRASAGLSNLPARRSDRPVQNTAATGTILMVEDDEAVRRVTTRILRDLGYTVWEAGTVAEARRICSERGSSIDLLLTDVVMPQLPGPELAAELSRAHPRMRVMYMSGYAGASHVHKQIVKAGTPYIEKPFSPASLAEKIRETLAAAD